MATSTKENAMAGPAPGRPKDAEWCTRYWSSGAFRIDALSNFWPAIAVPTMVKMPDPMTAPMPSDVRLTQPSDFFRRNSAPSQSEISWSMFLRRKRDEGNQYLRAHPGDRKDGPSGPAGAREPHFIVTRAAAQPQAAQEELPSYKFRPA